MDPKKRRLESQLCKAVNDGEPRSVLLFLTQGASPDLVGSKGVSAVHLAAGKETEKNTRCLKMLLQYGADPNTRSPDGLTPLHIAALWGCSQNLKLLLINGGNPNIKDNEGNTPGQLAEQEENDKCAQLLQEYQSSSVDTEDDDLPQFQYSVYSDQTDVSSYPESDYSFSSQSSMIKRMATVLHMQGIDVTSPDHVYVFSRESSESPEEEMEKTVICHCAVEESDDEQKEPKSETKEHVPGVLDKLALSEFTYPNNDVFESSSGPVVATSCESVDQPVKETQLDDAAQASLENVNLPLTLSPFVTGRTRSRLSRCSMRTSQTPDSLLFSSSLFEETLPTPVRTRRQTPRSHSSEDFYRSPHAPLNTPSYSGKCTGGDPWLSDCREPQSSTLREDSSSSQADTFILPRSVADSASESQTLSDTVMLEENRDSSMDAYERNLAEVVLAMRAHGLAEDRDFLTDDLTMTEDYSSQSESASSSSSSTYFSPRRSREDSDLPRTPGTGCTPRYSMSRLSSCRRPQHLANLSYTPGGRPLIQDLEEPVEYLYTDSEQGHELIETHVPPTANTSLSSSMSTSSSEETILYDWRREKENQKPQVERQEKHDERVLPDTKGLTDKELRLRLVEMGESPGPISCHTRPTYMRRLRHLMQESTSQSPHPQKQLDQPQTDVGYSPEMRWALRTFELPDCQADEQALCQQFDQPDQNRKWREGIIKSSFNYLLLDPRVTKNLPFRSRTMTPQECFQTFVHAIFYVGKGKRSRPYSHLYEALEYFKGDKTSKKLCTKVQHILQVWKAEQGVVSLHCFQNVIPVEAFTREACMVEAIGLKMLTNQKRGDFYGVVSNWQVKKKRELGVHLLYRAMQIFLAEGERQLRPADIRQK
ncbi:hypothetical protein CgunFtcFv8_026915 [Champsocephalus gunnari]|uniref:LEM domain-containing protein n=1 Tax=Champsocephalus gunnari TaxID=52237 RepID=A0AAN8I0Y5_CHAGU|nr:hypothetical protein CgunFtcFv8_026915 [Champsocephalus gunnari]